MLRVEDLAPLSGQRPRDAVPARRSIPKSYFEGDVRRRSILRGAVAAGTGLGLAALGVFPQARAAYADGYEIKPLPCPSYASGHNCQPGCGPSGVCFNCCTSDGFFRNDSSNGYRLRPNQCSGTYDGWLWRYDGSCSPCGNSVTYRCHDGYRRTDSGGLWVNAICRYRTACS